jgi:hypothetical protein
MKAEIKIIGVVPYGSTMFETQAEITLESWEGMPVTKKWSLHHTLEEAEQYMERFNKL